MVPAGRSIATLAFMVPLTLACTSILGGDYRAVEVEPGGAGGLAVGGGGGATGGAGAAGGGGVGGTGGVPELSCPAGLPGPSQALVSASTQSFCIDTTEVTRSDYETFLEAGVPSQSMTGEPEECAWNASYVPTSGYPFAMRDLLEPVVFVDWCDAYAYCAWAGKRLCGRFGGGPLNPAGVTDPTESEWHHVCTNGGATIYPYGSTYDATTCNGVESGATGTTPTHFFPECHGEIAPFSLVYDLAGNAAEWENSCFQTGMGAPETHECARRGGSFASNDVGLRCDTVDLVARNGAMGGLSFRCCAAAVLR